MPGQEGDEGSQGHNDEEWEACDSRDMPYMWDQDVPDRKELRKYEQMDKTSTGLTENVAGLLCYILGWVSGFVFILIEQENKFVRFHAMQSIISFGTITIIGGVLGWIPVIGTFFTWILSVISFILWVILMVKAYQGKTYKLPWAGDLGERWVG